MNYSISAREQLRGRVRMGMVSLMSSGIVSVTAQVNTGVCNGAVAIPVTEFICNTNAFVPILVDEFNAPNLDLTKWVPQNTNQRDLSTTPSWTQTENLELDGDHLRILVKREVTTQEYIIDYNASPPTTEEREFQFTSGEIQSYYKYGEGRYEIHCKLPSGDGLFWPAYWFYGQVGSLSNEVDFFEYWDNDMDNWKISVHRNGSSSCGVNFNTGSATSYKTFAVQWDRHNILWWRNDLGTVRNFPRWSTIPGQTMNCALMNLGFGGPYYLLNTDYPPSPALPGNIIANMTLRVEDNSPPIDLSAFPGAFEIDYIRYYRRVPCEGSRIFVENDGLLNLNGEYNFVTGTDLILRDDVNLNSSQQLEVVSTLSCVLGPGFDAKRGSNATMRIGPSNCGIPAGMTSDLLEAVSEIPDQEINAISSDFDNETMAKNLPINPTSIQNKSEIPYPNPTSNFLFVNFPNGATSWEMYNVAGEIVLKSPLGTSGLTSIDVSRLNIGLYTLSISSQLSPHRIHHRFVIDR